MHVAYWIVAGLLALFYLYAGGMKVTRSKEQLQPMMGWVDRVPMPQVRTIGVLEILGVLALIAAIGLFVIQVGAIVVHLSRGESKVIGLNIALLVLAAVAAWLSTS